MIFRSPVLRMPTSRESLTTPARSTPEICSSPSQERGLTANVFWKRRSAGGAAGLLVRNLAAAKAQGLNASVAVAEVPDIREALAHVADRFYEHPSGRLRVVGVTGTNGKTTWTYLTESILRTDGRTTGVIGTISYRWEFGTRPEDRIERPAGQTTPEAPDLQGVLREMADAEVEFCLIEVSSHGISLRRVRGTAFEAAVFTNLTQDHLDFHETLEAYYQAQALAVFGLSSRPGRRQLG